MRIGVPKEIKVHEHRVGMPRGLEVLAKHVHDVPRPACC